MTITPDKKYIESIEDRNPDKTHREMGWVLLRDGKELPNFRIRRMPQGFQAVVYANGFTIGEPDRGQVSEFKQQMTGNRFAVQNTWKDAVRDLFQHLAPMATPLDSLPNDEWQPANAPV